MTPKHPDDLAKWEFLRQAPHSDRLHPKIRRIALCLQTVADGCSECFAALAMTVARDCIRFVRDTQRTGAEDIAGYTRAPEENDAIDALARRRDDCDAKARVFVAICLAGGLDAHMVDLWRDGRLAHVSAAVYLSGAWRPVETTLARARVGEMPEQIPKEENTKRWRRS